MSDTDKNLSQIYYKRRLLANKIKRQINSKRQQVRVFRGLLRLGIVLLIVVFGISVLKLPQWHLNQNALKHAEPWVLTIEGNTITPTYKIVDMIRQTELANVAIYRLDTRELEKNITQLEAIKKVYVRRFWLPARLLIAVEERTPVFEITPNLEMAPISAITNDGIFIGRDYMPLSKKFHTTKILSYGVRGDDYEKWTQSRVDELQKFIKAIEAYSGQKVEYLDLRNPKDVYVKLEDVLVRFGEINDSTFGRAQWLATIIPETKNFKQKIKYIDLRWEEAHYIKLDGSEINSDINNNGF